VDVSAAAKMVPIRGPWYVIAYTSVGSHGGGVRTETGNIRLLDTGNIWLLDTGNIRLLDTGNIQILDTGNIRLNWIYLDT